MINMQSVCMCVFEDENVFFSFDPQSLIVWHPLKQYVQLFTPPPPPHPPPYHRGLKTSINVDTVDNGFSFYEMKCERIMYIITNG